MPRAEITSYKPTFGYLSDLGECLGDHALTEIRRFQMAEKPPSTDNSTPFTKLESSEARSSATVAISSGRPIFPRALGDDFRTLVLAQVLEPCRSDLLT